MAKSLSCEDKIEEEFLLLPENETKMETGLEDVPEELHLLILSCLKDRKDLITCSQAWTWWSKLLSPQKTTFLAPLVLPHLLPYLGIPDVLICRAQCKTWKFTMDYALTYGPYRVRDPPMMQFASLQGISTELCVFQNSFLKFHTAQQIDRFTASLNAATVNVDNPFIWRALSFDFTPEMTRERDGPRRTQDEYQLFYEKAFALLTRYGHAIWRFRYTLPDLTQLRWPQLTVRGQFIALMRLIKNVRSIELVEIPPSSLVTDERLERPPQFPRLRFLREMNFPKNSITYARFMQQMVAFYGTQIQGFYMHGSIFHRYIYWLPSRDEVLRLGEVCPNVVHLTVKCIDSPALWQLARCPQWRNLRQFRLILARDKNTDIKKVKSEIWSLLKMIYNVIATSRHLEELRVDLKQPESLPLVIYKKNTLVVNGTFDNDNDDCTVFQEEDEMKLLVPIAVISALKNARHLIIRAYKKTPINGFRQFEELKEKLMPLDFFWETMPWLRSIAVDVKLFDAEAGMDVFSDRILVEKPKKNKRQHTCTYEELILELDSMRVSPIITNLFRNTREPQL